MIYGLGILTNVSKLLIIAEQLYEQPRGICRAVCLYRKGGKGENGLKRLLTLLLCAMLCLTSPVGYAQAEEFKILTSFYPMYLLTANIAAGIEGVSVSNMAEQNVGCLHDYALKTGDMRMIHAADVVVINGAGMESFTDKILEEQHKPVIVASAGIELMADSHVHEAETEHDADAHEHHIEAFNAHVWMSPRQAMKQVENIAAGLAAQDSLHAAQYEENARQYMDRLAALDAQVAEMLEPAQGGRLVTSHPAFEYLARDYGLEVVASLGQEPGEMPRTHDMADLVEAVRNMDIKALFVEKAYSEKAAEVLSRETGIKIYTLDSLTSGPLELDAYEKGILEDAKILREALVNAKA